MKTVLIFILVLTILALSCTKAAVTQPEVTNVVGQSPTVVSATTTPTPATATLTPVATTPSPTVTISVPGSTTPGPTSTEWVQWARVFTTPLPTGIVIPVEATPSATPTVPSPTATPAPTPPPTPIPSPTLPPTTTPPATTPPAVTPITTTFDFDSSSPSLSTGQSTPFDQTSDGITAQFSSPSDPATFSVQSHDTTFLTLSQFSGNYLFDNNPFRNYLYMGFSQQLTSITLKFATTDSHGPGNVDEPSIIKLTAYLNSTGTTPVGSATVRGSFSNDSFPQGTLSFNSGGQPFNLVVIELLFQPLGGTDFLVDNITVTTAF